MAGATATGTPYLQRLGQDVNVPGGPESTALPALPAPAAESSVPQALTAASPPPPAPEVRDEAAEALGRMSGLQRVAALLIGLGQEASTEVLKHLPEEDIEQVTLEIFRMNRVPSKVTDRLMEEIYNALKAADFLGAGGVEFAQELLTRTLGPERAAELIARLAARLKAGPFDFLRDTDATQLVNFIQNEHPQTIALILSYLQPGQAALVLTALHPDIQSDVAMRIALMDRTAPDVVKEVERLLQKKVSSVVTLGYQSVGGVKHLVDVLNSTDNTSQKTIMDTLDEAHPELADEIKKNMFTFDDIVRISDRDMMRIVREVDTRELALALRGAIEDVRTKFYKGQSSRAAAQLKEDIDVMGPQRLSAIEDAQQKIVAVIRRLEQAEEITISRGGSDEFK